MSERSAWVGWLGLAAAALYVIATAAGSFLDPHYSQIREHVSELTAVGAPTWAALAPAYISYNLLVMAFAIGLYVCSGLRPAWGVGVALMVVNGLAGVGMVTAFRQDPGGAPTTFAGSVHLILAGLSSLTVVGGSIAFGVAFRRTPTWQPLARFSFASAAGFAVLGALAAIATAMRSDFAGLAERGPIGLFIAWLLVVGLFDLLHDRPLRKDVEQPSVRR
jgi:hypothetical protein